MIKTRDFLILKVAGVTSLDMREKILRDAMERTGLPVLLINSDVVDAQVVSLPLRKKTTKRNRNA